MFEVVNIFQTPISHLSLFKQFGGWLSFALCNVIQSDNVYDEFVQPKSPF